MKLIHLSDLHIGKRLNNTSFLEDQEYILTEILKIIDAQKPQAIMIAGDVYDKSIPPAEAVQEFDRFLNSLAKRKVQVLIISGNHDSPERLSFGNQLMEGAGIYISPVYDGKVKTVTLQDEHGDASFHLLPFVKPAHVRRYFPDAQIESYTDAMQTVIENMAINPAERNVLITHQFVTGATTCESEEFSVGGSDNVDASVFEGFDYVALGHIHGPQNIGTNRIRYCGTPLKYSLSEERHPKSVTVVDLGKKGEIKVDTIPLTPKRDLRHWCGKFEELQDSKLASEDYIYVTLTDEEDIPEVMGKLRINYPNLMSVSYDNTRTRTTQIVDCAEDVQKKSPLQLLEELYQKQNNQPMNDEQRAYSRKLLEEIMEGMK